MTDNNGTPEVEADEMQSPVDGVEDTEYAFIVIKKNDGTYGVQFFPEESGIPQPSGTEDIWAACGIIQKNVEAQQIAKSFQQAMMQIALQQRMAEDGKTKSGIVIPTDAKGR